MKNTRFWARALALASLLAAVVLFASVALAQPAQLPPGATPAPDSQKQTIEVLLSVVPLVAFLIAQVVHTGKLVTWTVPASVEKFLPPALGFLGAFGSALALGASLSSAAMLGIAGLFGGTGIGLVHTFAASKGPLPVGVRRSFRGGLGLSGKASGGGTTPALGLLIAIGASAAIAAAGASTTACTSAQLVKAETVVDNAARDFIKIAPEACTLVEDVTSVVDPSAEPTVVYLCDLIDGKTGAVKGKVPVRVPASQAAGLMRAAK